MAHCGSEAELAAFLCQLAPEYVQYASAMWRQGIKTPQQLATSGEPRYLACDVLEMQTVT